MVASRVYSDFTGSESKWCPGFTGNDEGILQKTAASNCWLEMPPPFVHWKSSTKNNFPLLLPLLLIKLHGCIFFHPDIFAVLASGFAFLYKHCTHASLVFAENHGVGDAY